MSIMEIKQVGYSYDNKKKVLKGVNAEMAINIKSREITMTLGGPGCPEKAALIKC